MPLEIVRNDITKMKVDAIVNAAKESLMGGGGVDGQIHAAAGSKLLEECKTIKGGCPTGEARLTKGYDLPAKYVIHTVGPIWYGGDCGEEELLRSCYRNSLKIAAEHGFTTVAFPLISTGIFGYPKEKAIGVATSAIREFLNAQSESDDDDEMTVYLVFFGRHASLIGRELGLELKEYIGDAYSREVGERFGRERRSERRFINALREKMRPREKTPGAAPLSKPEQDDEPEMFSVTVMEDTAELPKNYSGSAPLEMNAPVERPAPSAGSAPSAMRAPMPGSLDEALKGLDADFKTTLFKLIDASGMSDVECYKRANVTKQTFGKIKNTPGYKVGKQTAIALAVALRLTRRQTDDLLMRAGYALSNSDEGDVICAFFIAKGDYDIDRINIALFEHDQKLLGSQTN